MTIQSWGSSTPRIDPTAWVHPDATIIGDVTIGARASVWPGAVIRGDFGPIRVGARTSVQDNVVLHAGEHGTTIGADCVVGHLAFAEDATVEDACLVGIGARLLPGAVLRTGSVAAAGAVLAGGLEVPTGHRAEGVPARAVARARPDRAYVLGGARTYVEHVEDERRRGTLADLRDEVGGAEEDPRRRPV